MGMISITKLYDSLAIKLGKATADDLITFVQNRNDKDLESKLSIFATKEDLVKGLGDLESKISESKLEAKDMFTNLESKLGEWRIETKDMFSNLESKMSEWRIETKDAFGEVKDQFVKLDSKISASEKSLIKKISKSEIATIKWTVGLLVALAALFKLCFKS
jgi:hypothetical protein